MIHVNRVEARALPYNSMSIILKKQLVNNFCKNYTKLTFILDKCGLAEINALHKYLYFEKY